MTYLARDITKIKRFFLARLCVLLWFFLLCFGAAAQAQQQNMPDGSVSLQLRNYYFSRTFTDLKTPGPEKSQEWAQGLIGKYNSSYTDTPIQLGLDVTALVGLKLDSSFNRRNTGLLALDESGQPVDEYSRFAGTLKLKTDFAEFRVGELMPNVPLLTFSDIRLLPPSYQGLSLLATVLTQWRLQAGYLLSTSLRNSSGRDDLQAMLGHVPQRQASSDSFRYLGADYSYSTSTLLRLWHGKLEDIYQQNYLNLQYQYSLNADLRLKLDLGYFVASEQGEARLGQIDNKALYQLLSLEQGAHTAYLGYQQMNGDSAFPRVFANISILGNEVPTFEFASANERSWQLRYDTRFDALGLPGLVSTVRYIRSHGAMTATGADGQAFERDLDLAYQVQTGSLAGLSIRLRNVTARANYRTDIDENRLVLNYQLLFR